MHDGHLPGEVPESQVFDILLPEKDLAAVGVEVPGHELKERTLAAAVGPKKHSDLSLRDAEIQIRQDVFRAIVGEAELTHLHCIFICHRSCHSF